MRRLLVLLTLAATTLGTVACGSDTGDGGTADGSSDAAPRLVGVDAFAEAIEDPDVIMINVHTPHEGDLAGTDLVIPFDEIAESDELPTDLDTPLAVYCRSDNMSATAVDDLAELGYTDIVELDGGYEAWVAAGREMTTT